MNVDARLTEVSNTLRSIVGERAWELGLLDKRDIATLYAVIEGRKINIPASEDPDSHNTQHWLGQLVKDTGKKFGMREYDFEDQTLVNHHTVNILLSAEPERTLRATNFDAFVAGYNGPDTRHSLIDHDLLPPENPLVMRRKPKAERREKPEPNLRAKKKAQPATTEPSHIIFDRRWQALEEFAQANEMDADGITAFIASGPKVAINLDAESFAAKLGTARKSLGWNKVSDVIAGEKMLNQLAEA